VVPWGLLRALWAEGEEADWWVRSTEDRDLADRGLARGDITPVQEPNRCAGTEREKMHFLTEEMFKRRNAFFLTQSCCLVGKKELLSVRTAYAQLGWKKQGTMCPCCPASHASVQH